MTPSPLVELVGIRKTYANGTLALDDFNLSIADGEFVSLLGPSGCGKSTVLRMIAGLTVPTSGTLRRAWDGGTQAGDQPVSCVFQEPTLAPWADVWSNVFLPLRLRGRRKAQARPMVDEALTLVGLEQFAHAYPRELSGGMKMRASVARALLTRPRLLLLDEPFAALDEIARSRLNDDLMMLWRERQWAGLFITHSVYEAVFLSTRVLVMSPRPGRVVQEIAIDLPMKRSAEVRGSRRYLELCQQVSQALAAATECLPAGALNG
ncbi:MAG TPA: ABC transporter ATP-binding protein [Lacipirellula sp.]